MNKKGFTLIELLTVIAIIGILASIVVVAVQGPRARARDTRRLSDLKSIKNALEIYYEQNQKFPVACNPSDTSCVSSPDIDASGDNWSKWAESRGSGAEWTALGTKLINFISPLPKDPLNNKGDVKVVSSNCGTVDLSSIDVNYQMSYLYRSNAGGQNYKLMSFMEALCDGNNDGGLYPYFYEVYNSPEGQAIGLVN